MSKMVPKYSMWEAINTSLALGMRALEEIRTLARTPGPAGIDGKDGAPGRDGISFDDITAEYEDDGRVDVLRLWRDGKVVKEIRRTTKTSLFRGVHDHTRVYLPGDQVTRGGSQWHCNVECKGPFNGDDWTLSVKKGRDGKPD
jgi:hypothetical protein